MWTWMRLQILFGLLLFLTSSVQSSEEDMKEGCGETKGCVSDAGNNVSATYRNAAEPNWVEIELKTNQSETNIYVALGFSNDITMGEDYVVVCTVYNGTVAAFLGVIPKITEARKKSDGITALSKAKQKEHLKLEEGQHEKNQLYCKIKLMIEVPPEKGLEEIKFLNKSYHLFLAAGEATGPTSIRKHKENPIPTELLDVTNANYTAPESPPTGEATDIEEGCGKTKGCVSDVDDKIQVSYRKVDPNWVEIELATNNPLKKNAYVALGFSTDEIMGEDYVVACTMYSGKVGAFLGVNPQVTAEGTKDGGTNELSGIQEQDYLEFEEGMLVNGKLYCKLKLKTEVPSDKDLEQIKFLNQSYYLFLAAGPAIGPSRIEKHTARHITKPIKVTDTEYSDESEATTIGSPDSTESKSVSMHGSSPVMILGFLVLICFIIVTSDTIQ